MPKKAMAHTYKFLTLHLFWVYLCWHHTWVGDEQEGNKGKNEATEKWYNETQMNTKTIKKSKFWISLFSQKTLHFIF